MEDACSDYITSHKLKANSKAICEGLLIAVNHSKLHVLLYLPLSREITLPIVNTMGEQKCRCNEL